MAISLEMPYDDMNGGNNPMWLHVILSVFLLGGMAIVADDDDRRILFSFEKAESTRQWEIVNDGVMGGRSNGQLTMTADQTMQFFGTLSLANNGGFASVRTRPAKLDLKKGDTLVTRVRGDGREYSFNLYVRKRRTAFSYRVNFQTKKDEWIEVELPLETFVATSFGRVVQNQPLNPGEIDGLGILLGDKKAGPFKLEVAWIRVKLAE